MKNVSFQETGITSQMDFIFVGIQKLTVVYRATITFVSTLT
jgi:hypothetical protein